MVHSSKIYLPQTRVCCKYQHKEEELNKAQSTGDQLDVERKRLVKDLEKVNKLEIKINNELKTHQEKGLKMRRELTTFNNVDILKDDADKTKSACKKEKQSLQKRRDNIKVGSPTHILCPFSEVGTTLEYPIAKTVVTAFLSSVHNFGMEWHKFV